MTHSGTFQDVKFRFEIKVLIPLLLDDPIWANAVETKNVNNVVLIPLLLDDPLWDGI